MSEETIEKNENIFAVKGKDITIETSKRAKDTIQTVVSVYGEQFQANVKTEDVRFQRLAIGLSDLEQKKTLSPRKTERLTSLIDDLLSIMFKDAADDIEDILIDNNEFSYKNIFQIYSNACEPYVKKA